MPASTPVYGITYPCGGDTIDADAFATFASTMDAALAQGAADLAAVTDKPNAQLSAITAQTVVINTSTNLTFETEVYDNDGMGNLATNNDRLTCQTAGAYFVWGAFALVSGFTTLTSVNVILTVNGIEQGRQIVEGDTGFYGLTIPVNLVVGDIVRVQARWTGTGGPANVSTRLLTASLIATAP